MEKDRWLSDGMFGAHGQVFPGRPSIGLCPCETEHTGQLPDSALAIHDDLFIVHHG